MSLRGKKVAVLGAGGSGFAAASLALSHGALVAAYDSGDPEKLRPAVEKFAAAGVTLTCGEPALSPREQYDFAVISPGIDASWPIGKAFSEASGELIGEIEFAFRLSDVPVIAITGTNGKTTTTALIAEMLNGAGVKAVAAGNIGLAYSEVVESAEELDWIVLEASSFQLETVSTFQPEIAVWMNFAPDHMDRYETVDDYRAAKMRIFENRNHGSLGIWKWEEQLGLENSVTFSAFSSEGDFRLENGIIRQRDSDQEFDFRECGLHGRHNAENVMVALAVADRLGLDRAVVGPPVRSFRPPAHRCEKIAVVNGVTFINDSKSTNLHSLASALAGQEEPVILIAGGKEKGLDFSELKTLAARSVKQAICIGEIAGKIAQVWKDDVPCETADSVSAAVLGAAERAGEGDVVLFSPGTSSFDMFSGYEARGEAFREAVNQL